MSDTAVTGITIVEKHSDTMAERQGKVVVEADTMEQATSAAARSAVLEFAGSKWGMSKAGISNMANSYPAHIQREDGTVDESLVLKAAGRSRYRAEYIVTAGM